jgi:MFS family permease
MGWTQSASASILALLGYFVAGLGGVGLAVAYHLGASAWGFYIATVVIGLALGVIETMEPALISQVTPTVRRGRGMGALTGARSLGLAIG